MPGQLQQEVARVTGRVVESVEGSFDAPHREPVRTVAVAEGFIGFPALARSAAMARRSRQASRGLPPPSEDTAVHVGLLRSTDGAGWPQAAAGVSGARWPAAGLGHQVEGPAVVVSFRGGLKHSLVGVRFRHEQPGGAGAEVKAAVTAWSVVG